MKALANLVVQRKLVVVVLLRHLLTTLPHFELGYATSIYIKNGFTPFGVQKFLNLVWGTKTLFLNPIWSTKRF